jgi:hypothetical protein
MAEESGGSILTGDVPVVQAEPTSGGTWRESLPEDIREAGALKDIPDVATLAKAHVDAQSFIGRSVRIPGEDAGDDVWSDFRGKLTAVPGVGEFPTTDSDEETWGRFYDSMGRPSEPGGYTVTRPEGAQGNAEIEAPLFEQFHKLGLSNTQAEGMINWMNEGNTNFEQEQAANSEEAEDNLRQEWGRSYDTKVSDARRALGHYGGKELITEINAMGFGNSPALIKAFAQVGSTLSEDAATNIEGFQQARITPADAIRQIGEIRANANSGFNDSRHPNHAEELDRMQRLYQVAYKSGDEDAPDQFEQRLAG